jgi:hypothetical protein
MNRRRLLIGAAAATVTAGAALGWSLANTGSMADYAAAASQMRATLAERPQMLDLVRYAALAANGHNTQPWRFRVEENRIAILPDFSRRTPIVDPDDHHLFASLGCAAENLAIAAAARGRGGVLRFEPAGDGAVVFDLGAEQAPEASLFEAIPARQSTRADYDGSAVPAANLDRLAAAAGLAGTEAVIVTDRGQIERILELVVAGNSAQMADAAFLRELKTWLRFNPADAITTGDGLSTAASGNPSAPGWLGGMLFDAMFNVAAENDKYARQIRSSAGLVVICSAADDKAHWVQAGRACQRFALQATALGLKHAFINQPAEVASLRPELAGLVGMPGRRPDIVMRFGYGPAMPFSQRRPVSATVLPG